MGDGDRSSSGHFGPVDLESCAPPGTRLRDQSAAATILARCSTGAQGSLYRRYTGLNIVTFWRLIGKKQAWRMANFYRLTRKASATRSGNREMALVGRWLTEAVGLILRLSEGGVE
jgi:hypothetical protein